MESPGKGEKEDLLKEEISDAGAKENKLENPREIIQ